MADEVGHRWLQNAWVAVGVLGIVAGGFLVIPSRGLSLPAWRLLAITTRNTFALAGAVTVCCLAAGIPLVLLLVRLSARWERWFYSVILIPIYVNPLVLAFAFLLLLREGPVAVWFRAFLPTALYNEGCVIITMTYFLLPFLVLPLRLGLARLDPDLPAAARNLGASPWTTLVRIILPALRLHLAAGALLVFLQAASYFIVPILLGGGWIITLPVQAAQRLQLGLTGEAFGVVLVLILVSAGVIWAGRGIWTSHLPVMDRGRNARLPLGPRWRLLPWAFLAPFLVPPAAVTLASLGSGRYPALLPTEVSLRWFRAVLSSARWHEAVLTSAAVAAIATLVVCAFLWPLFLEASQGRGVSGRIVALSVVPILIPPVAFAVGWYPVMSRLGLLDTVRGVGLGEAWLAYPVAALPVLSAISSLRPEIAMAARNLGASRRTTVLGVLMPLLWPAALAGAALAALTAFNEVVLPIFWTSWRTEPLSRLLWDGMRYEIDPRGLAVGTLLFALTVLVAGTWYVLERRRMTRGY